LEEELRKRRRQLEPIDLRLGVETAQLGTEEARERLALVLRAASLLFPAASIPFTRTEGVHGALFEALDLAHLRRGRSP
jgi:hypothetical protein